MQVTHLPNFHQGEIGELTFTELNQVFRFCEYASRALVRLEAVSHRSPQRHFDVFDAVVADGEVVNGASPANNIWIYPWTEVWEHKTTRKMVPKPFGRASQLEPYDSRARNRWEENNGMLFSTFGVDLWDPITNPHPTNPAIKIEVLPIPPGTPVPMMVQANEDGQVTFSFYAPNQYKVTCGAGNPLTMSAEQVAMEFSKIRNGGYP